MNTRVYDPSNPNIFDLVEDGNIEALERLVADGEDLNQLTETGDSLLHLAITCRMKESIEFLLRFAPDKIDIDMVNAEGDSPLIAAADWGEVGQVVTFGMANIC